MSSRPSTSDWRPSEVVSAGVQLGLPADHIPQLSRSTTCCAPHTGFRYQPAAGLVPLAEFYGSLADGAFWSTQYIRHASLPLYTPEPDVIHEVIGHATTLASPRLAALYRGRRWRGKALHVTAGAGVREQGLLVLAGVRCLREHGHPKAYGAGCSPATARSRSSSTPTSGRLDIPLMGTVTYDITHYQPVLFCGDSLEHVEDVVGGFFESADDAWSNGSTALAPAR